MRPRRYFGEAYVAGTVGLLLLVLAACLREPYFVLPGGVAIACGAGLAMLELR